MGFICLMTGPLDIARLIVANPQEGSDEQIRSTSGYAGHTAVAKGT